MPPNSLEWQLAICQLRLRFCCFDYVVGQHFSFVSLLLLETLIYVNVILSNYLEWDSDLPWNYLELNGNYLEWNCPNSLVTLELELPVLSSNSITAYYFNIVHTTSYYYAIVSRVQSRVQPRAIYLTCSGVGLAAISSTIHHVTSCQLNMSVACIGPVVR